MPRWFCRTPLWYTPCHGWGWLIIALGAVFCATVLLAVNRHTHSLSDPLYTIFPYIACTALIIDRIAERTSHA